jgi:hypothetical protein
MPAGVDHEHGSSIGHAPVPEEKSAAPVAVRVTPVTNARSRFMRAASLLRMSDLALGDAAPDLVLLDGAEREVSLASLWQQRPLTLIFLRHFG